MLIRTMVLLLWASGSSAFAGEAQTSLRTVTAFAENPNNLDLYGADSESSNRFLLRQTLTADPKGPWRFEFNAYNLLLGSSDKGSIGEVLANGTDEHNRSSKLERHWHNSYRLDGYLTLDRLNARGTFAATDVTIGRFPINMSTTSIFTPNDFFAPFRAQNFYREYKPGVDALRVDQALGKKGQVSVMGVAGYKTANPMGRTGDSEEHPFAYDESSVLARASWTAGGFEGAVLGGKLGLDDMAGFTLQGEAGAIGLKAEGHQKKQRRRPVNSAEVAFGADYRPFSKLLLQAEAFSHGSGYGSVDDYAKFEDDPDRPLYFLGREYAGLGAVLEVTPLFTWKNLVLGNFTDHSALITSNLVYAVAENGEFSMTYTLPRGKEPKGKTLRSEFGAMPRVLSLETGIYF